ncbi:BQ2448_7946 [Microbotryum intermedium]|uniref:BQ2448_7946 protein n=1 Tax=Microbotryum intermedium TaxID=269621 RepID=A0A238FNQ2_9BASI|nr:BQ2448_7946 [Microbotryum intermedium]
MSNPSSSSSTPGLAASNGANTGGSATPPTSTVGTPSPSSTTGSLGRSSARRSLRQASNEVLSAHPLLASPPAQAQSEMGMGTGIGTGSNSGAGSAVTGAGTGGTYPVYSRSSTGSMMPPRTSSLNPDDRSMTTDSSSPSMPSSSLTTAAPPLISRPSNSTLPYGRPSARAQDPTSSSSTTTPSTRAYARSISGAQQKLQGQQLKAEVQALGLGHDSVGAMMVNKLVAAFTNGEKADWSAVLGCLTGTEKAVLLLPAERIPSNTTLSSTFFMDHLALVNELPSTSTLTRAPRKAFVTLGGMRGFIDQNEIVFASHCPLGSTRDLNEPKVLSSILQSIHQDVTNASYPSIFLVSTISKLAIPRPSSSRGISGTTGRVPTGSSTSSRLAALFVKPSTEDLPPLVPAPPGLLSGLTTPAAEQPTSTPPPTTSRHHLDVSVLTIGKIIRTKEIQRDIFRATVDGIRKGLKSIEGCNEVTIVDRVIAFVQKVVPNPSTTPSNGSNLTSPSIEEIADSYQDLSDATRVDLGRSIRANLIGSKDGDEGSFGASDFAMLETRVDDALERVEHLLTTVLYDRLYSPAQALDAYEDEKLSSRIRGLRAMDLSLDHLGVDMDNGQANEAWAQEPRTMLESLEDVISLVGKELNRLSNDQDGLRSPKTKLSIFVGVHQLIVDQLSELPPVPLKKEISPNAASGWGGEIEMDDAASLDTTGSNSRSLSPTREVEDDADDEDHLLKTPTAAMHEAGMVGLSPSTVPEISLPGSELAPSVEEALSSSVFDPAPKETTPMLGGGVTCKSASVAEEKKKPAPSSSKASSVRSRRAPASSSADLILPLLIYATLQHDPPLPSHLKYAQRFRAASLMRGEASYCATNIQAVIEFLTTVDVSSLGMINSSSSSASTNESLQRPPSTASTAGSFLSSLSTRTSRASSISSLRKTTTHHLSQQVSSRDLDQFVDQANRSLVNVVGMLFGPGGFAPKTIEDVKNVLDGAGNAVVKKATGGYLRRGQHETGVKGVLDDVKEHVGGGGVGGVEGKREGKSLGGKEREMVDFVPGSMDESDQQVDDYVEPEHTQTNDVEAEATTTTTTMASDQRSIRSLSSLLRRETTTGTGTGSGMMEERPSLGERIASFPGLSRFGPNATSTSGGDKSSTSSTNAGVKSTAAGFFSAIGSTSPSRSRRSTRSNLNEEVIPTVTRSTSTLMGIGPDPQFLGIQVEELRIGQVGELLLEYQRLAKAFVALQEASLGRTEVAMMGGVDDGVLREGGGGFD